MWGGLRGAPWDTALPHESRAGGGAGEGKTLWFASSFSSLGCFLWNRPNGLPYVSVTSKQLQFPEAGGKSYLEQDFLRACGRVAESWLIWLLLFHQYFWRSRGRSSRPGPAPCPLSASPDGTSRGLGQRAWMRGSPAVGTGPSSPYLLTCEWEPEQMSLVDSQAAQLVSEHGLGHVAVTTRDRSGQHAGRSVGRRECAAMVSQRQLSLER